MHVEDLKLLFHLCHSMYQWICTDAFHSVVVLTIRGDADYGSAMLASCYLLYTAEENEYPVGMQALEQLGLNLSKLYSPSQTRYINFFNVLFMLPSLPNAKPLNLRKITVCCVVHPTYEVTI